MAKSQKQTGYLVKIEAFVPADLDDIDKLALTQKAVDDAKKALAFVEKVTITPTRR